MTAGNRVLRNNFGDQYVFNYSNTTSYQDKAAQLQFDTTAAAEQFLKSFGLDDDSWARELRSTLSEISPSLSPAKQVCQLLLRERLTVHALPKGYQALASSKLLRDTGSDDRYEILSTAAALLQPNVTRRQFKNAEDAYTFIESIDFDESFVSALRKQVDTDTAQDIDPARHVATLLAQGKLVLLNHGPLQGPLPKVDVAENAGRSPVPLAPESQPWIEIKLVDEDGEPVCEQEYWIKDSQGKEHKGKTNQRGIARLDKIPEGLCEISFPELEDWS